MKPLEKLNIKNLTKKQKITAIVLIAIFAVGLALGLSLGLTLPVKSVQAEGGAVLLEGEEYESGLFLIVTRRSGKKERVAVKPYMVSPFDSSERGEKSVVVTYKNRKIDAKILIVGLEETTCSVRIGSMKTDYEPKESVSEGGILDLAYNDKPFRSFPITLDMISGFDSSISGEYEATITFRGLISCTYRYRVMKIIKSLEAVGKLYAEQGMPLSKENVMGNGTILVTYTDETTENISIYNEFVEISTQNLEEREENYPTELELSFRGQTFVFAAEAYLKGEQYAVESMQLILPKLVYKVGESINLDEAILSVRYRYYAGTVRVAITPEMIENYKDFSDQGTTEVKVVYMNAETKEFIRVVSEEEAGSVTSLSTLWRGSPSGTVTYEDDLSFDDDSILYVEYGYGYYTKAVRLKAEMVSKYDKYTPGPQNVTITYGGFSAEFPIVVQSPADSELVTQIFGLFGWKDETYKTDPALVIADDAVLYVEYGYGVREAEVSMKDPAVVIENFVPGEVGFQTVTIKYRGQSYDFIIVVRDDTVEGVTGLSVEPQEYVVGESFDPERCVVVLQYKNGKVQEKKSLAELIPFGATYEFTDIPFNSEVATTYVISVSYEDFSGNGWVYVRENAVVLSGISVDTSGGKTTYSVGEGLDITGFVLYVHYSDSTVKTDVLTYDMIGGFENEEVGTRYASVSYNGRITWFKYTIKE